MKIILASNSPRRKELLAGLGYPYEVRVLSDIDESYPDTLRGSEVASYISRVKADAYARTMAADELIITADTIVWLDGEVMGKPQDEEDARRMLRALSGRTHQVITGVCLTSVANQKSFATVTDVTFARLTEEEISYYVERYRPMDKAGSYGIQGGAALFAERIEGDYFNVVGLPVSGVYKKIIEKL